MKLRRSKVPFLTVDDLALASMAMDGAHPLIIQHPQAPTSRRRMDAICTAAMAMQAAERGRHKDRRKAKTLRFALKVIA